MTDTKNDTAKAANVFLHIPRDASHNTSLLTKICIFILASYVIYVSFDSAIDYFTQPLTVRSVYERLQVIPELQMNFLSSWELQKMFEIEDIEGHEAHTFREASVFHGVPETLKRDNNLTMPTARKYLEVLKGLMDDIEIKATLEDYHDYNIRIKRTELKPSSLIAFANSTPYHTFFVSSSMVLHGDYALVRIHLNTSCSRSSSLHSDEPENMQVLLKVLNCDQHHLIKFTPEEPQYRIASLKMSKWVRTHDCVQPDADLSKKETDCLMKIVAKNFNCCLCSIDIYTCSRDMRCCSRNHLSHQSHGNPRTLFQRCSKGRGFIPKRRCHKIEAAWTNQRSVLTNSRILGDKRRFCASDHGYTTNHLILKIYAQYNSYSEHYPTTIVNVFSSIGGVLGFFLGGSVVSIVQLGIMGYYRLVDVAGSLIIGSQQVPVVNVRYTNSLRISEGNETSEEASCIGLVEPNCGTIALRSSGAYAS